MLKNQDFLIIKERFERIRIQRRVFLNREKSFCENCLQEVSWLTLIEVAQRTGKAPIEIIESLVAGDLDFHLTKIGLLLICEQSIRHWAEEENKTKKIVENKE